MCAKRGMILYAFLNGKCIFLLTDREEGRILLDVSESYRW